MLVVGRRDAAQAGTQVARPAAGLGQPGLLVHRCGTGLQLGGRAVVGPAQQLLQCRDGIAQAKRRAANERFEHPVDLQQSAPIVVQHHALRAQVEPVRDFTFRTLRAHALGLLQAAVLQHRDPEQPPLQIGHRAARCAEPAFVAMGVEQPLGLGHRRRRRRWRRAEAGAQQQAGHPVPRRLQLQRVAADQLVARLAGEPKVGRVDVDQPKGAVLQGDGDQRFPDQPHRRGHPLRQGLRVGRRLHSAFRPPGLRQRARRIFRRFHSRSDIPSQGNAGPPQVSLTPSGGGRCEAAAWGHPSADIGAPRVGGIRSWLVQSISEAAVNARKSARLISCMPIIRISAADFTSNGEPSSSALTSCR